MKKLLLLPLIATVLFSCGENKKKTQPEIKTVETAPTVHKSAPLQAKFKDGLIGEAYKDYNAVKTALVNSDGKKTQQTAEELFQTLKKMQFTEQIGAIASKMAATADLEKQRTAFQTLTEEILKLVEANLVSGKLYYQYCPMAFGGKGGYWLSNTAEIRNPYFGDRMLKCGKVVNEIN